MVLINDNNNNDEYNDDVNGKRINIDEVGEV